MTNSVMSLLYFPPVPTRSGRREVIEGAQQSGSITRFHPQQNKHEWIIGSHAVSKWTPEELFFGHFVFLKSPLWPSVSIICKDFSRRGAAVICKCEIETSVKLNAGELVGRAHSFKIQACYRLQHLKFCSNVLWWHSKQLWTPSKQAVKPVIFCKFFVGIILLFKPLSCLAAGSESSNFAVLD